MVMTGKESKMEKKKIGIIGCGNMARRSCVVSIKKDGKRDCS